MPIFLAILLLAGAAFAQSASSGWYAWRNGYEKCRDDVANGLWICREDYVNNFCFGKERVWKSQAREKHVYDRNAERIWFDRTLIAVRNLNAKCEYHGWSRFKIADGSWKWQCYVVNKEMEDSACKGFRKR
jgi:hypothetical protein